MSEKKSNPIISIGTSLVLVVFIILALVTFAIMSAVSARSDYRSAVTAAQRTTAYYNACNTASNKLAEIDGELKALYQANPGDYIGKSGDNLKKLDGIEVNAVQGKAKGTFIIPIDNHQELYIEFTVTNPAEKSTYYTLDSWLVRSTSKWDADSSLNLIQID